MFRLKSLEVENFGPFKGRQRIDLPSDDGVVMIYGENMRGKTTLLNAIRFAFFGKFVGRGSREIPLSKVGNWEAAAAGVYGFEVRLDMVYEGVPYRLTRSCTPRPQTPVPVSDEDFTVNYYLERDGVILGPNDGPRELERILPEQISRFFLFDGELLQEYEDLLLSDSLVGERIAASIERILGMPVLTRARTSLVAARDLAAREQASAAQGDQKTQQLGNALSTILAKAQVFAGDFTRQEGELVDLRKQKALLEDAMRKNERTRSILDRRDYLEEEKAALEQKIEVDRLAVQTAMAGAWTVVLRERMKASLERLRDKQRDLQNDVLRGQVLRDLADRHVENCPTCRQRIDSDARSHLAQLLKDRDPENDARLATQLSETSRRIAALDHHIEATSPDALRILLDNLADTERGIHGKRQEIKDLSAQLAGVDEDDIRQARHDHERVIKEIKALEDGVEDTKKKITENDASRDGIQAKLARFVGGSVESARAYFQMTSDLFDLMDQSVSLYRDRLRHRVQDDASRHFRALTTEPEYSGLRINDSYGLSILHENGSEVPLRSAGAEHVVALSLVAALQNNAHLRGPIIIDSPFVRLDGGHKEKIMKALPTFASQVLMLVYEDEMPPARARAALAGSLKAEFELQRRSSRHTELVEKR